MATPYCSSRGRNVDEIHNSMIPSRSGAKSSSRNSTTHHTTGSGRANDKNAIDKNAQRHICLACKSSFGQRKNLLAHTREYHQTSESFSCPSCGEKFGRRAILRKHIRDVHEASVRYTCHICSFKTRTKDNVRSHIRTFHKKEPEHRDYSSSR